MVVLDEIHTLTGTDRGNQIICQLCRISRLIGRDPVRVGLSATIGDTDIAAKWLGAGSERGVSVVGMKETRTSWRLGMEHFYIQSDSPDQSESGNKYLTAVGEATPGTTDGAANPTAPNHLIIPSATPRSTPDLSTSTTARPTKSALFSLIPARRRST